MLRRARTVLRQARSSAILTPLVAAVDRWWWARMIRRADIVDVDFVAAQGGPVSSSSAVRAYVRGGFRSGLSLNPLMMERLVSSQLSDAGRVPALYAYLVNDVRRVELSVAWDAPAYALQHPEAHESPGRILGHAWRQARRDGVLDVGGPLDPTWSDLHDAACAVASGTLPPLPPALPGTVLVIARFAADEGLPSTPLREARVTADRLGATLILSVAPGAVETATASALIAEARPATFVTSDDDDIVARVSQRASSDARIVVRGPHAEISADDLVTLANKATDGPVAPLWLGWDGAIASAGVGVHANRTFALLTGLPREDAMALGPVIRPHALAGDTFARPLASTPGATVRTLTDAIVRAPAPELTPSSDIAADDTDVDGLVRGRGWTVSKWTSVGPVFHRPVKEVTIASGERVPSLRWAIKIAAPPGPPGEAWGDTHFARGIADALRQRGQDVVIDAYAARARATAPMDDVVLALRGPEPLEPQHGAVSLLWVISHPDELHRDDVAGFDATFAASESWAREKTVAWGLKIHPLLQCTDSTRFRPSGVTRSDRLVFVGTARGIARPSVVEPLRAGFPVDVYGPDWRGYVPPSVIVASHVPNTELPRLYEGARAVLNDHWPAMRRHGFVSNRLFDVVAAGGRAISDDVDGIQDIFGGAVATYTTVAELLDILETDAEALFPADRQLAQISSRIRREHSFDARAQTLLDTVLRLR